MIISEGDFPISHPALGRERDLGFLNYSEAACHPRCSRPQAGSAATRRRALVAVVEGVRPTLVIGARKRAAPRGRSRDPLRSADETALGLRDARGDTVMGNWTGAGSTAVRHVQLKAVTCRGDTSDAPGAVCMQGSKGVRCMASTAACCPRSAAAGQRSRDPTQTCKTPDARKETP